MKLNDCINSLLIFAAFLLVCLLVSNNKPLQIPTDYKIHHSFSNVPPITLNHGFNGIPELLFEEK